MKKYIAYFFILLGLGIAAFVFYSNSKYGNITRQYSAYSLLSSSWENYKKKFINADGRVVDFRENSITTSEGQSYAMMRSVWMDDKETFDNVWKWTRENLDRPDDELFSWRWGKRGDKTYGVIENGGENSASDADQDITFALLLASSRWEEDEYASDAATILPDLWEIDTGTANGKRYLIGGNWAKNESELVVNPSYFAPYAWRIFAKADKTHDWEALIDPGYELLAESGRAPLDKSRAVGLPPDWVIVNRTTGELSPPVGFGNFTTNYSFDAVRVPWRVALDYKWNKDERAKEYLNNSFSYMESEYARDQRLEMSYFHDGVPTQDIENPVMYSTIIGYFAIARPDLAEKMYQEKIVNLYTNDRNNFRDDLSYYEHNWLWFGAALYNNFLTAYTPKEVVLQGNEE